MHGIGKIRDRNYKFILENSEIAQQTIGLKHFERENLRQTDLPEFELLKENVRLLTRDANLQWRKPQSKQIWRRLEGGRF
jgi:hypothetical protein